MHATAALLAGHPARAGHGDASVEGDGELERDERPPRRDPVAPGLVLRPRLERVGVLDLDARCGEQLEAAASLRVRVERAGDHLRHPRPQHGLGAGRRRAVVGARLHRHVQRRPAGPLAGRRRARPPRRAGRPCARASPRRRPRRPRPRPRRRPDSAESCRARARRARSPARDGHAFGVTTSPRTEADSSAVASLLGFVSHASAWTSRRYARGRSSIPKIADPATIRSAPAS